MQVDVELGRADGLRYGFRRCAQLASRVSGELVMLRAGMIATRVLIVRRRTFVNPTNPGRHGRRSGSIYDMPASLGVVLSVGSHLYVLTHRETCWVIGAARIG